MDIKELVRPFWETDTVLNETVLLLSETGEEANASLFFKPQNIISITSTDGKTEYIEGVDYYLSDGKIYKTAQSRIPYLHRDEICFADNPDGEYREGKNGGYVLFKPGITGFFHSRQLNVTYTHTDKYMPNIGLYGGKRLKKTRELLSKKQKLTVCFYGDSITDGCDCSGHWDLEPHMPEWTKLITSYLEESYQTEINYVNTSVPGKSSEWGAKNAKELLADYCPDLAVIAFGMNDGTANCEKERFGSYINTIMEETLKKNPECEFILVSTTLANPESRYEGLQKEYYDVLVNCARENDAVADMTSIHDEILKRKRFQDTTANNINHPNDFLARIYAQVILKILSNK